MLVRTLLFSGREMIPHVKEIEGKFQAFYLYFLSRVHYFDMNLYEFV